MDDVEVGELLQIEQTTINHAAQEMEILVFRSKFIKT